MLDLAYEEDSRAEVDMNFVMTGSNRFIELQATAEQEPFGDEQLARMTALARKGIGELLALQKSVLDGVPQAPGVDAILSSNSVDSCYRDFAFPVRRARD